MPRFTFIKHADDERDSNITVTFREDHLPELRQKIDEFLRGSGFYCRHYFIAVVTASV